MSDFLQQLVQERRADAAAMDEQELARAVGAAPKPRPFAERLRRSDGQVAVIAEVKRISPALGTLAPIADPAALARTYAAAGAAAISVLTEPRHWGGSLHDLTAVRDAVDVPVLCKDVIVDGRQLLAARVAGADAVLLIAEALDDEALEALLARASELGMGALVEAHEVAAFRRALASDAVVVGVNARDLREPSRIVPERVREVAADVPAGVSLVAESGLTDAADVRALPMRVDAILVGTALVRAADPGQALRDLRGSRAR